MAEQILGNKVDEIVGQMNKTLYDIQAIVFDIDELDQDEFDEELDDIFMLGSELMVKMYDYIHNWKKTNDCVPTRSGLKIRAICLSRGWIRS